jgi:hypothetical protein
MQPNYHIVHAAGCNNQLHEHLNFATRVAGWVLKVARIQHVELLLPYIQPVVTIRDMSVFTTTD